MSGGFSIEATNLRIKVMAQIESIILCNKTPEYEYNFSYEIIEKLMEAIEAIKTASIYLQQIDCLLEDKGQYQFLERLEEELK